MYAVVLLNIASRCRWNYQPLCFYEWYLPTFPTHNISNRPCQTKWYPYCYIPIKKIKIYAIVSPFSILRMGKWSVTTVYKPAPRDYPRRFYQTHEYRRNLSLTEGSLVASGNTCETSGCLSSSSVWLRRPLGCADVIHPFDAPRAAVRLSSHACRIDSRRITPTAGEN